MKTLILYKTKGGATKQYAQWLQEELPNSDISPIDDFDVKNLSKYETVIIGSCVYGGQMPALEIIQNNWSELKSKRVFFFTVGAFPSESKFSQDMYMTIPQNIREHVQYAKLPGQMSGGNPSFLQKMLFKLVLKGDKLPEMDRTKTIPIVNFAKGK